MIPLEINIPEAKRPLDVVTYEFMMLNQCCLMVQRPDYFDRVIPLESFLMHARNLIDFLSGCCYPNDIKCTDFIDKDGEFIQVIPINISEDLKLRINRHCQHMSMDRLEKQIGWPVNSIAKEINEGMIYFAKCLPDALDTSDITNIANGVNPAETSIFHRKSHS